MKINPNKGKGANYIRPAESEFEDSEDEYRDEIQEYLAPKLDKETHGDIVKLLTSFRTYVSKLQNRKASYHLTKMIGALLR